MRAAWGSVRLPADERSRWQIAAGAGAALILVAAITVPAPHTALWLLLTGAALALALTRPEVLCYLLPPAVALDSVLALQLGPLRAGPTDLLAGALAVSGVVRLAPRLGSAGPTDLAAMLRDGASRRRALWRREPALAALVAALAAYLGVVMISVVVATSRAGVAKETLKWGEVLLVFALATSLLTTPMRREIAAWAMVATGVAEALLGYAQWVVATGDLGAGGASLRVFGTFDQPNPYAAYLNLVLPLAAALALYGRRAAGRWLATGAVALLLGAQLLAASRGGLLALVAAGAVMLVVGLGVERIAVPLGLGAAALLGLAGAVGLLPHGLQRRALDLLRLGDVSLNGPLNDANFSSVERLAHWEAGIRMFLAHPLLGVGAGNYDAVYARYKVPGWEASLGQAHNYYINAAAETGVLGAAAFVALVVAMLALAWRTSRTGGGGGSGEAGDPAARTADGEQEWWALGATRGLTGAGAALLRRLARSQDRGLALGVLGVVVAVAVHSLVDDVFVHGMALQLTLCLALAAAMLWSGVGATVETQAGAAGRRVLS